MSNSSLVTYTKLSPFCTHPRSHAIDTVTIHCMAGNLTVESCGNVFQKTQASSNYGIGTDGRIALYVDERDRSWASSNPANDHRAVTIEVANDGGAETGWHVSAKAYDALIRLLVDICQRNRIKKLLWKADKSLVGNVAVQNMTVHRWFANKSCPGDYLYSLHGKIASDVNARLAAAAAPAQQDKSKQSTIGEEEIDMTKDELRKIVREEINAYFAERDTMAANADWQKEQLARVKGMGITDGSRPQAFCTRLEAAIMSANTKKLIDAQK